MTTIDALMTAGARAEASAEARRANPIDWRLVIIGMVALIPRLLGITVGAFARVAAITVAAFMDGFHQEFRRPVRSTPMAAVAAKE